MPGGTSLTAAEVRRHETSDREQAQRRRRDRGQPLRASELLRWTRNSSPAPRAPVGAKQCCKLEDPRGRDDRVSREAGSTSRVLRSSAMA